MTHDNMPALLIWKTIKQIIAGGTALILLTGAAIGYRTKNQIQEIFYFNQERKREGYYLSEFEFTMLGAAYYLDHGQYITALARLNAFHKKLKTTEGLVKIPTFSNAHEKLDFYQALQNPKTGAFMDDSYPLFTYFGVTDNMLALIEDLSKEAHEPFRLNYPLTFLDDIQTPESLIELLDELATVGWLGAKFKAPYVEIGELWSLAMDAERLGLYSFSPAWKQAYLQWSYENQEHETGLWGARLRGTGKLLNGGDLVDCEKMIGKFLDHDGQTISPDFPLRYRDKLFESVLKKLALPMPDDLDELHEWILARDRGIRLLTRYLWQTATADEKEATRKLIEEFVNIRYTHYYVEDEGAFSLYPHAEHADLDGTGEALGMYKYTGLLSPEKQRRLWGDPREYVRDLGTREISELTEDDFAVLRQHPELNSVRFYRHDPNGRYLEDVEMLWYPGETNVPDAVEIFPRLEEWVQRTPQNMGNWVTRERLSQRLPHITAVPVLQELPLEEANEMLRRHAELIAIGFDVLQVPRVTMIYTSQEM